MYLSTSQYIDDTNINLVQSTPVNSDVNSICMSQRPPFRDDQSNIIRLIRISPY